ncbi:NAD-P-binding protein [Stereum hirsutum FP-91666 SS1]|uniref:NAD-P-binding protein n=1 Tax=Stereum hirsutum (strain FP-91666) TaxID=721885 RepID=UPI000440D350|nr:NAD-P-binding protein [Stereum hirsutum FP-91666 SS1]EIM88297.1 NAD-P-binding protein [Stereum hirsutum FP-91666 SS1]
MSNAKFSIQKLFDVEDWVAVVSGGGTGIGLMIAQAFANNGARVYILGRREDVLKQTAETHGKDLVHKSGKIIPLVCDITDKKSLERMAEEIGRKEKRVDVLVNNSGISQGSSSVEIGDESAGKLRDELWSEKFEEWEDVYRTNVIGHFFTTVALIPLLSAAYKPGHSAAVINITSMSGITRTSQHHFKYNVSKGAAIHLSTLLAQELRRPGVNVRVNNIAPGIFPSEMTTDESDEYNKSNIDKAGWAKEKGVPAGRAGSDEDMAQAALMLAVNQYAYGQTVAIEGGYLLEHP